MVCFYFHSRTGTGQALSLFTYVTEIICAGAGMIVTVQTMSSHTPYNAGIHKFYGLQHIVCVIYNMGCLVYYV